MAGRGKLRVHLPLGGRDTRLRFVCANAALVFVTTHRQTIWSTASTEAFIPLNNLFLFF